MAVLIQNNRPVLTPDEVEEGHRVIALVKLASLVVLVANFILVCLLPPNVVLGTALVLVSLLGINVLETCDNIEKGLDDPQIQQRGFPSRQRAIHYMTEGVPLARAVMNAFFNKHRLIRRLVV